MGQGDKQGFLEQHTRTTLSTEKTLFLSLVEVFLWSL